jgi:hemoglobin-like flavoprotein
MNEDFDRDRIWSTGAHEAMPGHFMQLSIARRHPDLVRRLQRDAAFAEGWAFYGEEMLVRLGLYGDGLDARLYTARWERVRGARAIVDPKLASGEWSVEQAVDFFEKHSGFTRGGAGGRQRHRPLPGLRHRLHGRPAAAAAAARRVHVAHRRARVAARLPRPAAVVRLDAVRGGRARAPRRPRQAGHRGAGGGELLIAGGVRRDARTNETSTQPARNAAATRRPQTLAFTLREPSVDVQQISLVRSSFALVQPIASDAAALFYDNLFRADPSLRPLFEGDMTHQGQRLMGMIGSALQLLDRPAALLPVLRSLGARHAGYRVREEHYDTVGSALILTLEQGLGAAFTPEARAAWIELYGVIAGTMREGAREPAPAA